MFVLVNDALKKYNGMKKTIKNLKSMIDINMIDIRNNLHIKWFFIVLSAQK